MTQVLDSTKADDIALVIEEAIVSGKLRTRSGSAAGAGSQEHRTSPRRCRRWCAARRHRPGHLRLRRCVVPAVSRDELHGVHGARSSSRRSRPRLRRQKITREVLSELEEREQRFAEISKIARDPGRGAPFGHGRLDPRESRLPRRHLSRSANLPLVEQLAKSARRSFSGPAVWARATTQSTASTRRTPSSTARSASARCRRSVQAPASSPRPRPLLVRPLGDDFGAGRRLVAAAEAAETAKVSP